jgi:hypothetical protein
VSLPDYAGKLSEVSLTVSTDSEDASAEKENTVESYSIDVPGATLDGKLHIVQRVTTKQSTSSNGRQTSIQQVEQPNPGDPGGGLRVITIGTEDTRSGQSDTESTRTVQVREWQLWRCLGYPFQVRQGWRFQIQIGPANQPK